VVLRALNYDYNLNVAGNGPYNPGSKVIAWHGWSGGHANETWTFQIQNWTIIDGWTHTVAPECKYGNSSLALSLMKDDPSKIIVAYPNASDALQLWTPIYVVLPNQPPGIAFVNKSNGHCLRNPYDAANVTTSLFALLDQHSLWTIGGTEAVRPNYNSNMNLNVRGNGPYAPGHCYYMELE